MASGQSDSQRQIASSESRWAYWGRTLRPLFWWLLLVLLMYGYRLNQRLLAQTRIDFSVTWEGLDVTPESVVKLDGHPVASGERISLGKHTFTVSHPKAVAFTTNFFAWYGPHDFGTIHLQRTVGNLKIIATPLARIINVTGPEYATTLVDVASRTLTVPTDAYVVKAVYPHSSQSQNVNVSESQGAACSFKPQFGAVQLTCNHAGATYMLQSSADNAVYSGNLPIAETELPTGSYQATVNYHDRHWQKTIAVKTGITNVEKVVFTLGAVHLETEPPGATVENEDEQDIGTTPLTIQDLSPQMTWFKMSLPGYEPADVTLSVIANQTNSYGTNLLSVRYVSAMAMARQDQANTNYVGLAQATTTALAAKPGDAAALALQKLADAMLSAAQARKEELARPRRVFNTLCEDNENSSLFATHEMTTSKPAKQVEQAIVAALKASPGAFTISSDNSPSPDTYTIVAQHKYSLGILGGMERDCLMVVGQAKPDETQIWFKVLEYEEKDTLQVNGLFHAHNIKQLIPITPVLMRADSALRDQVLNGLQVVESKINQATG